jgi:TolB-like protein/DNA-binding winged helix-turn-helix (wHTH) protein/Tfp pilus assembly protein PilF
MPHLYEFDGYVLDPLQRLVRSRADGQVLHLTARVFDALHVLVVHRGQLIDKSTLMQALWPDVVVEEGNLTQTIYSQRQLLGEKPGEHRFIATVPGRGYRFVAEVREVPRASSTPPVAATPPAESQAWRPLPVHWGTLALGVLLAGGAVWFVAHREANHSVLLSPAPMPAITAPRTSVAVLPFANLTGDASKEYWGDGMAEELINTLSKIPGLKVPARSSTFAYKGRNVDVRQIARDLGVTTVLEGSVRSAGDRIRITAQLSDAAGGFRIWSESYDRQMTDLFKLQDDLAISIERALQLTLVGGAPITVTQAPPTTDVEAYRLTLQGFALIDKGLADASGMQNTAFALEFFKRALALDPNYARAYGGMAIAYYTSTYLGKNSIEGEAAAEHAARLALTLDPDSVEAEAILAHLSEDRGDLVAAELHRRRGLALWPNEGTMRRDYAWSLTYTGHLSEAIQQANAAYELLPTNQYIVSNMAEIYSVAGNDPEALKFADLATKLGAPSLNFASIRARAALHAGLYAESEKYLLGDTDSTDPDEGRMVEVAKLAFAALVDPSQRAAALAARARLYPHGETFSTAAAAGLCAKSARAYVLFGAIDMAYDLENQCLDQMSPGIGTSAGGFYLWTPEMRRFRHDRRFQALCARLGFMPYFEKYGPPDLCNLKQGKLTCR